MAQKQKKNSWVAQSRSRQAARLMKTLALSLALAASSCTTTNEIAEEMEEDEPSAEIVTAPGTVSEDIVDIAGARTTIDLDSPAFRDGGVLPEKYTSEGEGISPPLKWSNVPPGTDAFVVVMDSPRALGSSRSDYWVVYNIPGSVRAIEEGLPKRLRVTPSNVYQGVNTRGEIGYLAPSDGVETAEVDEGSGAKANAEESPQRYYFRVYALDERPVLRPGATKENVLMAIRDQVLAVGELTALHPTG